MQERLPEGQGRASKHKGRGVSAWTFLLLLRGEGKGAPRGWRKEGVQAHLFIDCCAGTACAFRMRKKAQHETKKIAVRGQVVPDRAP